jgi:hypothetical protein
MSNPIERIEWGVYSPFPEITALCQFSFASINYKTKERMSKIRENSYVSNRYRSSLNVRNIKIDTSDYFILTHRNHDVKTGEGKVIMSYPHMNRFITGLSESLETFRDNCFEKVENGFILTTKGSSEDAIFYIYDLYNNASLAFQPTIITMKLNDDEEEVEYGEPGIRLYLNDWNYSSCVTLDEYDTFISFYNNFSLFNVSLAAVQVAMSQSNSEIIYKPVSAEQPKRLR